MPDLTQAARRPTEGGLMNHRIEFAREDQIGVPPADPEFQLFSDVMNNAWNWAPDGSMEAQRGLSHVDAQDHFGGPVENEVEFAYQMQKDWTDGDGNALDASHDFFFRDEHGQFHHTHTVMGREVHPSGGTDGAGFRTYTVAVGGYPSEAEAEADASEAMPLPMTTTYQFEKVTSYVINQPSSASTVVVSSDDEQDTGITVTIESEGAEKSEELTLNGTTLVVGETDFSDIDAVRLGTDAVGDVTVSINDGGSTDGTAGAEIVTIAGKDTNSPPGESDLEGDLGVPTLGSGSRETQVEPAGERTWKHFRGDRIERVAGAQIGPRLNSTTLAVDNNVDSNERQKSRRMALDRGIRNLTLEGSIAGPQATHQTVMDHLQTVGADIEWEFNDGQILRLPNAVVSEPGELAPESEQIALYVDSTFQSEGVALEDGSGAVLAE